MNRRKVIRLILSALVFWLAWIAWLRVEGDPMLMLAYFLVAGVVLAVFFVKVVLARIVEGFSQIVFFPGGKSSPADAELTLDDETEEEEEAKGGPDEEIPSQPESGES